MPDDFTIATVPARFAELGDLHAGIDDAVFDIDPLLEWAERDERDGRRRPRRGRTRWIWTRWIWTQPCRQTRRADLDSLNRASRAPNRYFIRRADPWQVRPLGLNPAVRARRCLAGGLSELR